MNRTPIRERPATVGTATIIPTELSSSFIVSHFDAREFYVKDFHWGWEVVIDHHTIKLTPGLVLVKLNGWFRYDDNHVSHIDWDKILVLPQSEFNSRFIRNEYAP